MGLCNAIMIMNDYSLAKFCTQDEVRGLQTYWTQYVGSVFIQKSYEHFMIRNQRSSKMTN